jgi:hypothetical protein
MRLSTSLLLWVLLGLSWPAWAQEPAKQVRLQWQGQDLVFPQRGQGVKVPSFAGATFAPGQRVPSVSVAINGYAVDLQVLNPRYEAFTTREAAAFASASVDATPQFSLQHGIENRQHVTLAALPAVRRNAQTSQLEKLLSFEYTYRLGTAPQARTTTRTYAPNSALSSGDWFKIGVTNDQLGNGGVFKLDKAFLRNLGLPVQSLDPRRLKLFGYSVGMLPQANSADRPDDLAENAIYFADNGSNNANFDDDEYFLFYSPGPHTWSYKDQRFTHALNIYADTAYYFLTIGSSNGRRVTLQPAVTGTPTTTISEYTDHFFYERELVNLLHSGRQWLGEGFNANAQKNFDFNDISNLVPGSSLQITSAVAATALPGQISTPTTFSLTLNGNSLGAPQSVPSLSCDPSIYGCYPEVANGNTTVYTATAPTGTTNLRVGLTYSGSRVDPAAAGYLDYLEIQARRQLTLGGSPLLFRSLDNLVPNGISTFVLQNATANTVVWDVTDPRQAQSVAHANGRFVARTNTLHEYAAFSPTSSFATPRAFGRVANQNLHAIGATSPIDLVIVTPPVFKAQAERLAAHRRTHDGLNPTVVTTQQIYNEFSSGGQDITAIRDFVKMIYDRPNGRTGRLYVLLFGDASYDYKADASNDRSQLPAWWASRPLRDADNQNFVPTYEAASSFNRVGSFPSYCSDDFYGFLDDNEGEWSEDGSAGSDMLDAGIGRLPVRFPINQPNSTSEAVTMVDKLIGYDSPTAQGKWRNRLTFVADDGDNNEHLSNAEISANPIMATLPAFQVGKVYLDMYPQQSTSGGQGSPAANAALDASLEQGTLLAGYAGHGGPRGWMDEKILTNASVLQLQNQQRLTFMFTGTCDFAWYDDPAFNSAGEQVLTDTRGGGIGLLTTTRLVYASNNQQLANRFFDVMFKRNPSTGQWPRVGDAVAVSKNLDNIDVQNRNFTLLGDPSMRLAMPYLTARATRVSEANDPTHAAIDTLRALQQVQLEGEVVHPVTGALQTAFQGKVQVTVYEKMSVIRTLGNESPGDTTNVRVQKDVVYDGKGTVRNGRFSVQFVVPKDINYSYGFGKISLYAYDSLNNVDAHGANPRIVIGGARTIALTDSIPPVIRLAMDDTTFVFGGLTKPTTTLLARFSDASGINTAGTGIGHELTATLDNDPSKVTVLNEYYTADVDKFTSGRVSYLFKNLSIGPHVLRIKAWDTFNNSAEKEIEFIAARNEKLALEHILNYPNPFAGHTTFHFDHNRSGDALDVQVQIFTVSGKLVRTLTAYVLTSESHVSSISWDGRDDYNDQLARGVYVYRLSVRTPHDGSRVSKFEKLVLLN